MLESQLADDHPRIGGARIGVPEIRVFGATTFRAAATTADTWAKHDCVELVCMLEGESCWETDTGRLIRIAGGQALVFPGGCAHRILHGIYEPSRNVWLLLDSGTDSAQPALLDADSRDQLLGDLGVAPRSLDIGPVGRNWATTVAELLNDPRTYAGIPIAIEELRASLHGFLVAFWKGMANQPVDQERRALVTRAVDAIQATDVDAPQINALARQLGCSRGHLHNVFRQEMGMSPKDYLQRLRIKRTSEALSRSDDSITEIAHAAGYASSQYFARVFRKYVGTTPRDYRARMRVESTATGAE